MNIRDNSSYQTVEFIEAYPKITDKVLDKSLKDLSKQDNLLIFPPDVAGSSDLENDHFLLESQKNFIKTGNLAGFIGFSNEKLTIRSRFSIENDDYFLHYLLKKVLNINLFNLSRDFSFEEHLYQFLIYLLPKYLSDALKVGLYKEYRSFHFNDNRVKGTINIARHIRENTPFRGNIAYDTRQLTYDNPVMHLIRYTIDVISKNQQGRTLLNSDETLRNQIKLIKEYTPSYSSDKGQWLVKINYSSPVRHAYYSPYRRLQKLCLMILASQKHGFSKSNEQIYGILFDVSWLWEEYLSLLLPDGFIHSDNKRSKFGKRIFSNQKRTVYPDFYSKDGQYILDAKYKKLEKSDGGMAREDLYQLISYSYIFKSLSAGLIYPSIEKESWISPVGQLNGYGAHIFKVNLQIPKSAHTFAEFVEKMCESEQIFKESIYELDTKFGK